MYAIAEKLTPLTNASSGSTTYSGTITGPIYSLRNASTEFGTSGTFTLSLEQTGETVLTKTLAGKTTWHPRCTLVSSTGGSVIHTTKAGGQQTGYVFGGGQRLKLVLAGGGAAKTGAWYLTHG